MKLIAALVMLLALSACNLPVFFRVPVVQGNIVTSDQVAKLKIGMTRKQVAYVLGTPLIETPFEDNRWNYVFYYRNPRAHVRESNLGLYFVDGKLSDIEGNEEYAAEANSADDQSQSSQGQLSRDNGSISSSSGLSNTRNDSASGVQRGDGTNRTSTSNNPSGANRPVTTKQQPTPAQPLPHRGPPLPGQPDQGL